MVISDWLPRGIISELAAEEQARNPGKNITIGSVTDMLDRWESERAFGLKVMAVQKAAEYHENLGQKIREAKTHLASKTHVLAN